MIRFHEGDEPHFHDWSPEARAAAAQAIWQAENVELTTVGIDIGSSTSHLMFSRVHLQRKTQLLSSEFAVVGREVLWRSPILFTPFLPDFTIDAGRLGAFIDGAYAEAGLDPQRIDSGAVILTGEAIKRRNAQAIAGLFAAQAGKLVCASAGHHMECVLAAHGAGATAISRRTHRPVLNVDIGGGTTKLALIENGEIRSTCAIAVGGRLIVQDAAGRLTRLEASALQAARSLGTELALGQALTAPAKDKLVDVLAEAVLELILGRPLGALARELLLTGPLERTVEPHLVTFSGGVSEYLFGREARGFGDIAQPLAERMRAALAPTGRLLDPGQGIRATVIGASQFTVQLSGKTIHLSRAARLPLRNVPVVFPPLELERAFDAAGVARAIGAALARLELPDDQPAAVGIRWRGEPYYARLRELAAGIAQAARPGAPLVVLVDRDVGRLLGHILEQELGVAGVIAIDGVQLRELDYVDIGELLQPSEVVPLVIKSLLFPLH
ncbi:MAG TPA: ethanolamine ammonia-lyase reactivating factor EutA [Burkholderiales bacterium]